LPSVMLKCIRMDHGQHFSNCDYFDYGDVNSNSNEKFVMRKETSLHYFAFSMLYKTVPS
jgi:hypothetical protein